MEANATSTTILAAKKSAELNRDTVLDHIIACAKALDKADVRNEPWFIPVPYWYLEEIERRSRVALAKFKLNNSHFMYRNKSGAYRNY